MRALIYCTTFFLLILITACSPTKTIVDTSCSGYKDPDFNREEIAVKGMAIMPVLGGAEKEQFRRPMGDALTKYFRVDFNNIQSPNDVITILNNEKLTDEYTNSINNYATSGIIPKALVSKLGNVLNVNYLLYTRLLADTETDITNLGYYSEKISVNELYVQSQVWDTKKGDVVWEGKGGCAKLDRDPTNLVDATGVGLTKVIGLDKNAGPCENKEEIFSSVKRATTNSYLAAIGIGILITALISLALVSSTPKPKY